MRVNYQPKALKYLDAKLQYANGPGSRKLAVDLAAAVELGNEHDRLRGLDRHGRPQPAVKPRRGKYKGATGPPLAPSGAASRVVRNFRAEVKGSRPPYRVLAGWEDVVSRAGVPFLPFLDQGVRDAPRRRAAAGPAARPATPRGGLVARAFARLKQLAGGGWYIPPRPHFGISPNTWALIRSRVEEFKSGFGKAR